MRMMCHGRIDRAAVEHTTGAEFEELFRVELDELRELEKDGLVTIDSHLIEATPLGQFFLRNLALPFDRYLRARKARPDGVSRTFSRTI
jgi:oxygen-independent coproporphyrinogen-3 oxidase